MKGSDKIKGCQVRSSSSSGGGGAGGGFSKEPSSELPKVPLALFQLQL